MAYVGFGGYHLQEGSQPRLIKGSPDIDPELFGIRVRSRRAYDFYRFPTLVIHADEYSWTEFVSSGSVAVGTKMAEIKSGDVWAASAP